MELCGCITFMSLALLGFPSMRAEFEDPCRATTRPCFQPYIDQKFVPEAALSDSMIDNILLSNQSCSGEWKSLADCVLNGMLDCSDEFTSDMREALCGATTNDDTVSGLEDPCRATTRPCFQPYIDRGDIPEAVVNDSLVDSILLSNQHCSGAMKTLADCIFNTMLTCSDELSSDMRDTLCGITNNDTVSGFEDPCRATTRSCFQPYIDRGDIPDAVVNDGLVDSILLSNQHCSGAMKTLADCIFNTMLTCSDELSSDMRDTLCGITNNDTVSGFEDPCRATTRPCFQPYIDRGDIPVTALNDSLVDMILLSNVTCSGAMKTLADCIFNTMLTCSDELSSDMRDTLCGITNNDTVSGFEDPCRATTRPCFQPYIHRGDIPVTALNDRMVDMLLLSNVTCSGDRKTLADCIFNTMLICSDELSSDMRETLCGVNATETPSGFEDPCRASTRPCFQPYIDRGEILEVDVNEDFVNEIISSSESCSGDRVELADCIMDILVNCSDEFKFMEDKDIDVTYYVGDIVRELLCEVVDNTVCVEEADCEHEVTPHTAYEYPTGGYAVYSIVGLQDIICEIHVVAAKNETNPRGGGGENAPWPPISGLGSPRLLFTSGYGPDSDTMVKESQPQCTIDQMASAGFTECLDLALQDYPKVVMYLNMVYLTTPEEMVLNCKARDDLHECIETHVGGVCNEQSVTVAKDGLFILGFLFDMSTCGPDITDYHGNGATTVAMEMTVVPAIFSIFCVIMSFLEAASV